MSDSILPPASADRNLLLGVFALQLDFIRRTDLLLALQACGPESGRTLGEILVERNLLTPQRRELLENLLQEFLLQHDMDTSRGLAAACAARNQSLDLEALVGPALRGGLATLPSIQMTVPAPGAGDPPPPPSVGVSTSSGKRFRIIRPHARGALGEVFLARDEELNREVALKEIQERYADHPDCRARFLREAEITSNLEHPSVVPVYGLGFHADGRPYYAMRFIRGESLQEAIHHFHEADGPDRDPTERALTLRGLLSRFVGVCNAVAYAHSRGVVHRDIKPSNIMLGPYGETLVVDWGLAKVDALAAGTESTETLIQPLSGHSARGTILGQAVGTPAFMPPEQAAGRLDRIGPCSDVYSLGATLYNLVTGEPPYGEMDAYATIKQVEAHSFAPPRRVKRETPAALEAIILKAMSHDPNDRYLTVHALAQEVERFLADEPVTAYPEPVWQQLQRWTRRRRTLVSGLAVLLVTAVVFLCGGMGFLQQEQRRTARERNQAQENLALAEANLGLAKKAVDECFLLAKEHPLLQQDKSRAVRKLLLVKALEFYKNFKSLKPNDAGLNSDLGRNLYRVAYITNEIGKKTEALESCKQAHKIYSALASAYPDDESHQDNLAETANLLGILQSEVGKRTAAMTSYNQACELLEALVKRHKDSPDYQSELAYTYNNRGVLLRDSGQPKKALADHRRARDLQMGLVKQYKDVLRYQADLAATQHNLGEFLAKQGDPAGARRAYDEARSIREHLTQAEPLLSSYRSDLAATLDNLGTLQREMNEPKEAFRTFEQALKLRIALVQQYPEVPEHQSGLASVHNNVGVLQENTNQLTEAVASYKSAFQILEPLVAEHPEVVGFLMDLGGTCCNLGNALREAGMSAEALTWYARVFPLMLKVRVLDPERSDAKALLQKTVTGRAQALTHLGRHREAVADWSEAVRLASDGERDWCRQQMAYALARSGDHVRAMREVAELEKPLFQKGESLYELACISALASTSAREDRKLSADERTKRADSIAVHAVALLDRADKAGLFQDKEKRAHILKDRDLESLRERSDFRKLLAVIEGKSRTR